MTGGPTSSQPPFMIHMLGLKSISRRDHQELSSKCRKLRPSTTEFLREEPQAEDHHWCLLLRSMDVRAIPLELQSFSKTTITSITLPTPYSLSSLVSSTPQESPQPALIVFWSTCLLGLTLSTLSRRSTSQWTGQTSRLLFRILSHLEPTLPSPAILTSYSQPYPTSSLLRELLSSELEPLVLLHSNWSRSLMLLETVKHLQLIRQFKSESSPPPSSTTISELFQRWTKQCCFNYQTKERNFS